MNINNNQNRILGSYGKLKGDFFTVPGTFQPTLAPRFSNVNYGPNIRYREPSNNHLGVPPNHPFIYEHPPFNNQNFQQRWNNRQC